MTNLSKIDRRTMDMILAHARAGNYTGAQQLARSFIASAPSDAVAAKRKAAVTENIFDIIECVDLGETA